MHGSTVKKCILSGIFLITFFGSLPAFAEDILPSSAALLEKGKTSFQTNCVTCHGEKGDGNGPAGQYLNPKPRNYATDKFKAGDKPQQIFNTITNGLKGTAMTGFGHLSKEERSGLAYYVLSFRKKK